MGWNAASAECNPIPQEAQLTGRFLQVFFSERAALQDGLRTYAIAPALHPPGLSLYDKGIAVSVLSGITPLIFPEQGKISGGDPRCHFPGKTGNLLGEGVLWEFPPQKAKTLIPMTEGGASIDGEQQFIPR